jgi:hypothetical protein
MKSFEATGIYPPNAEVILKRFAKGGYSSDDSSSSCFSGEDWVKIESIIRRQVKDQRNKEVKKLRRSLHHISTQASLLRHEGASGGLWASERGGKRSPTLYNSTILISITVEPSSGLLRRSVRLGTMRRLDNNNYNSKKHKKQRGLRRRSKRDLTSFRRPNRSVLRERGLRRRGRRSERKSGLKKSVEKQFATLKKLYNSPKTASVRPHKAPLKSRSVKKVLVMLHDVYKPRWLHLSSQLKRPARAAPPRYQVNISSASSSQ